MRDVSHHIELVTVTTVDGQPLDGARYRSRGGNRQGGRAFLLVHGMRWSFFRGPSRWLGSLLADRGYDCLSLNLRDYGSSEPRSIADAHHDLRAGVESLFDEGVEEVIPLAHGYGGLKVMSYHAHARDDRVGRQVVATLGAVRRNAPVLWTEALESARAMRGRTLVVQGAADKLIDGRECAEELERAASATTVDLVMLENGNHYFDDRHDALVGTIADWEARWRNAPGILQ